MRTAPTHRCAFNRGILVPKLSSPLESEWQLREHEPKTCVRCAIRRHSLPSGQIRAEEAFGNGRNAETHRSPDSAEILMPAT
jgi:hypothetical protein